MKQYRLIFIGSVRGVGFRENFRESAEREGVKGWIRNFKEHEVEAVVQVENLESFISKIRREPFFRGVDDIKYEEEPLEELEGFTIRYE